MGNREADLLSQPQITVRVAKKFALAHLFNLAVNLSGHGHSRVQLNALLLIKT